MEYTKEQLEAMADLDLAEAFDTLIPMLSAWRQVKGFELEDPWKYREATFVKELIYVVKLIAVLTTAYANGGQDIYPSYAIEKLNSMRRIIDTTIKFYEAKGEDKK